MTIDKQATKSIQAANKELGNLIHEWASKNNIGYMKIEANIGNSKLVNLKLQRSYSLRDIKN